MRKFFFLFLSIALLFSCANKQPGTEGQGNAFSYAKLLRSEGDTAYTVLDPWQQGKTLQTVSATKPYKRVVVFTTAHCKLMEYLGVADRIVGVCDAQYILIPDIQKRLRLAEGAKEKIEDCGSSMSPDIERIIALKPDAIILSPYEGQNLGRLSKLGIPVILAADYMETSSLGRAEWMRYFARLFDCAQRGDSLFHVVDSCYQSLKAYAAKLPKGKSVLTERKTGAVWYTPGGESTVGITIRDAHGGYAFANDKHSGSLALSFEQILAKAGQSDVWAVKYNGPQPLTKKALLQECKGYSVLKAMKTGQIYVCDCSVVPYFEEVSWRPDWQLREFIQLLHPQAKLGGLRYYRKENS